MKKLYLLVIGFLLFPIISAFSQETLTNSTSLNFPFRKYGISLGNSSEFSGIRLNLSDKDVKRINGINLTLWYRKKPAEERGAGKNQIKWIVGMAEAPNKSAIVNGLNAGFITVAGTMQPFNFGVFGLFGEKNLNGLSIGGLLTIGNCLNGISIGGLGLLAPEGKINGLAFGGLAIYAQQINGLPISPLFVVAKGNIRGLTVAGLWAGYGGKAPTVKIEGLTIAGLLVRGGEIKGVPVSIFVVNSCGNLSGLAVSGISVKSNFLKGVAIAGITNVSQKQKGLSIALVNTTKELHGLQFGLINYAGNNRKGLKIFPVLNMHWGKKNY